METYQRNRIYSLIVGTEDDAVEINNLQIQFEVTKTSNNKEKKNQAKVSIYNLTRERQKALEEDYVTVILRAGYGDLIGEGDEIPILFSGQVVDLEAKEEGNYLTKRQHTDIVTTLTIDELFSQLNGRVVSKTIPAGKTVKDAILGIVKDMPEITRHEIKGEGVKKGMVDGMPLSGTPRQLLDQLSKAYTLEWQIDNNILYVTDVDGTSTENLDTVPKIGQFSGLIDRPMFKSEDVKRIRLKDKYKTKEKQSTKKGKTGDKPKKTTLLDEVTHKGDFRGRDWHSSLILSVYE